MCTPGACRPSRAGRKLRAHHLLCDVAVSLTRTPPDGAFDCTVTCGAAPSAGASRACALWCGYWRRRQPHFRVSHPSHFSQPAVGWLVYPTYPYSVLSHSVSGCLWVSLGVSGCLWVSLSISGCLRMSQNVSGYLRVPHVVPGCLMLSHGVPRCLWVSQGVSDCLRLSQFHNYD